MCGLSPNGLFSTSMTVGGRVIAHPAVFVMFKVDDQDAAPKINVCFGSSN